MTRSLPRVSLYMRNKHFGFEELGGDYYRVSTAVEDTFFAGEVKITVHLPEWEIRSIEGRVNRSFNRECQGAIPILQKVVGTRIGAGLTKKVDGLIGGSAGCTNMANLVLESCHMAVDGIHFHVDQETTARGMSRAEHRQLMLKQFPYLNHQCIRWSSEAVRQEKTKPKKAPGKADLQADSAAMFLPEGSSGILTSDRSKFVQVGKLDNETYWTLAELRTTVHDFTVEMEVKAPSLEIIRIKGKMSRAPGGPKCRKALLPLQNAVGVPIGPGLTARIDANVARAGCPRLGNLVLESCHAVLQATVGAMIEDFRMKHRFNDWDDFKKQWLESMPLMKNSCMVYCQSNPFIQRLGVNW